jgi:hypothetical protein
VEYKVKDKDRYKEPIQQVFYMGQKIWVFDCFARDAEEIVYDARGRA